MKRLTRRTSEGEVVVNCEGCPCYGYNFCELEDCTRELLFRLANIEDLIEDNEDNKYNLEKLRFRIE